MDPIVERLVALTPADRKWMDDILHDVTESWNENDPQRPISMQYVPGMSCICSFRANFLLRFKGSDDYLRVKASQERHILTLDADEGALLIV